MAWTRANYADKATPEVVAVCCGDPNCFNGEGCDTAKWWTARMEKKGYRLIQKLVVVPPASGGQS